MTSAFHSAGQSGLGLQPVVLSNQSACLADVFEDEASWQAFLRKDPSVFEAVLPGNLEVGDPPQVGPFCPDLALKSSVDMNVLVELQLGDSDARHVGQVLRYSAHGEADAVLWLAEGIRPEDAAIIARWNQDNSSPVLAVAVTTLAVGSNTWTMVP